MISVARVGNLEDIVLSLGFRNEVEVESPLRVNDEATVVG